MKHVFVIVRRGMGPLLALLGGLALAGPVRAQTAAIDFATSALGGTGFTSTRGFVFDITSSVTVTGLSVFDADADGLVESHDVGLWDSSGTLLASLTVPAGTAAPLDSSGKFRYVLLGSPVSLPVATGYRVGAVAVQDSLDQQFYNQTGLTSAAGVSYGGGAFINNGGAFLTFPSSNLTGQGGFSGGSFIIGSATSAPEPGTLALLALGMAGGIIARRRRK
jgi:Domain of unknown function (DUF4082)/PEP-CTERM motif